MPECSHDNDGKAKKKYAYYKGSLTIGKRANGKPYRKYVYGKTKRERDEKLDALKRQYARGLALGEMTVYEWSLRWKSVFLANVSDNQKKHYTAKLTHDILPAIGPMRMRDIRPSHLMELINNYSGGKEGTVAKVLRAVKKLFADAEYEGIIERDPAKRLELPYVTEKSRRPLDELERKVVLRVAETHTRGPYVLTMLYCGLRRGECIALERSDVDLDNRRINISKELVFEDGNVGKLTGTKSSKLRKAKPNGNEACARTVPIPDLLLPFLEALCEGKNSGSLLFPKADGKHATQSAVSWWWSSFRRQCHFESGAETYRNKVLLETSLFDNDVTPHYLRHSYATDLYAAGVDEFSRKAFLGHENGGVTEGYTAMSNEAFYRNLGLINVYLHRDED